MSPLDLALAIAAGIALGVAALAVLFFGGRWLVDRVLDAVDEIKWQITRRARAREDARRKAKS